MDMDEGSMLMYGYGSVIDKGALVDQKDRYAL